MAEVNDSPDEEFERCSSLCAEVMRGFDLDPDQQLMESDDGCRVWGLRKGSANILLIVRRLGDDSHLHVVSPILVLPELELEDFYRSCKDYNSLS